MIFNLLLWANILKYKDPTCFSGPPWRADKQDISKEKLRQQLPSHQEITVHFSFANVAFNKPLLWLAIQISDSCSYFRPRCSAGWSIPGLPRLLTSWKFPNSLTALGLWFPFPARHDRFLKDHLKMLNFPFFVKVFGALWAVNGEKTAHCSMFFPPKENLCLKRYF